MTRDEKVEIGFTNEIIEAIKNGKKIEAIKLLRTGTGLGLKEAKEAVEAYLENNSELKEAFNVNKSGGLSQENSLRIIILILVLILAYLII
jgi:ribosomal protein L7/L12